MVIAVLTCVLFLLGWLAMMGTVVGILGIFGELLAYCILHHREDPNRDIRHTLEAVEVAVFCALIWAGCWAALSVVNPAVLP